MPYFWLFINTTAYRLANTSLYLLPVKCSMYLVLSIFPHKTSFVLTKLFPVQLFRIIKRRERRTKWWTHFLTTKLAEKYLSNFLYFSTKEQFLISWFRCKTFLFVKTLRDIRRQQRRRRLYCLTFSWITNFMRISATTDELESLTLNKSRIFGHKHSSCSLEGAFTIFCHLKPFFFGISFQSNHCFTSSNCMAYFDAKNLECCRK